MYKVYLLQSLSHFEKSYVGLTTKKIKIRLEEHNAGFSKYTKAFLPWKIVYFEQFYCKLCAEKREEFLKNGVGYQIRKHLLLLQNSSLKKDD
jgi:putative endonuclease